MDKTSPERFRVALAQLIVHPRKKDAKAMLIEYEGNQHWIPYSQVSTDEDYMTAEPGDTLGDFYIPAWLAKNKGMI
jgi:hypothetical protein